MRPKERRDSGQTDMFRARLDQIVDPNHALAKLGRQIDWRFLEERFGAVYSDKPGQPPLPIGLEFTASHDIREVGGMQTNLPPTSHLRYQG